MSMSTANATKITVAMKITHHLRIYAIKLPLIAFSTSIVGSGPCSFTSVSNLSFKIISVSNWSITEPTFACQRHQSS